MPLPFAHRISRGLVLQLALEGLLVACAILGIAHTFGRIDNDSMILIGSLAFGGVIGLTNAKLRPADSAVFANVDRSQSALGYIASKTFAPIVALPIAFTTLYLIPQTNLLHDALGQGLIVAITGLVIVRGLFVFFSARDDLLAHRILVVGTGRDAVAVEAALAKSNQTSVLVSGFYASGGLDSKIVAPERIIPEGVSLAEAAEKLRVNEIVVATREQRGGTLPLRDLVDCRLQGIRVTCLPSFFERFRGEIPIDSLKAGWLIYSEGFRQNWGRTFVKSTFDLIASLFLLAFAAPVMLVVAVAIRLESKGPVIYRQERVGLGGKSFQLLKFRSMYVDAEKDGVPRWASSGDSRVTAVGRFIRLTRIDELPQVFNVLKGDMSFVGPRPERSFFVQQLAEQIPFYRARLSVKPGITGWAQTRYCYGASVEDAVKKLQYDLYYVKNHTLMLDLVIVLKTVRVVLFGEGAR
jgi:sugar transferase (PEP-CTERM system associated)